MKKSQLLRLTKVLIIPFIALGLFLANSSTILNKKIIIECFISNGATCFGIPRDLYTYRDNEVKYQPFLAGEYIDVRITPSHKLIFKKINAYSMSAYRASDLIEQDYNNGIAGYTTTLITNPYNSNKHESDYKCHLTRYNYTDLIYSTNSYSSCVGNIFFTFAEKNDNELMLDIDSQAIDIYKKNDLKNTILSIILFFSPFIFYILIIIIVLLFKKTKNYVIND